MEYCCLLCLERKTNSLHNISVHSTQWEELNIKNLIEKHFWPMQPMEQTSWLCNTCWEQLNDFHKFYIRVEDAHMHFGSTLKIEMPDDDADISTQEVQKTIKDEKLMDELGEDDVPLKELCKLDREINGNLDETIEDDNPLKIVDKKHKFGKNATKPIKIKRKILPKEELDQSKDKSNLVNNSNYCENRKSNNKKRDKEMDKFIAEHFKLTCIHCQAPMETFVVLNYHFKMQHNEQPGYVMCCSKKINRRHILYEHLHHHLDPNYLRCKHCDKVFSCRRYLKLHNQLHDSKRKKNYECDICGLHFTTPYILDTHKTIHLTNEEKMLLCPDCGKSFGNYTTLNNHLRAVHTTPIICDICGKILVNKANLKSHKTAKHSNENATEIPEIAKEINTKKRHKDSCYTDKLKDKFIGENIKLSCDLCQVPLKTFAELREHFATEHKQRAYVICCNKKIFHRGFLLDHLHQHTDPNYLKCKLCDRMMSTRPSLRAHIRTHVLKREKQHCCDVCGATFINRHILETHKTRHLSEEEKLFPCTECAKNFGSKVTLKSHIRSVHRSNTNCHICGLMLSNKSALKMHISIKHPVDKPIEFICPICSKLSPNRYAHNKHVKDTHQLGHNHKCTMCDRAFKRASALKEHMATHTGVDLYTCKWCPKTFKAGANLSSHRLKAHAKEWEEEKRKKYAKLNEKLEVAKNSLLYDKYT